MAPSSERVHVYCRLRPGTAKEQQNGLACQAGADGATVAITTPEQATHVRSGVRSFEFDKVYAPEAEQQEVYDEVGAPILDSVLQGYNGTVLAYGQTGTGKTHTLLNVGEGTRDAGLVPRLVAALFVAIKCDVRHVYKVKASFAQIYNEQIDDLLSKRPNHNLRVKPKGTGYEVEGLLQVECKEPSELLSVFDQGRRALVYAETKMNKHSSRSHAVLQLLVSRRQRVLDGASHHGGSTVMEMTCGKLTVVDLAGSERVKKSGADEDTSGKRMREAININTSLLGLSNVMKALSTQASHIPYRDSKLTHMLCDALGGNCKTSLVVCASPSSSDVSETTTALEFGARAMKVKTYATVNSSEVALDAAALAEDLSEALRLQADGQLNGQLLAMEAELRERRQELQALEEQAQKDLARRDGDLSAALAESEGVRAEAAKQSEELQSLAQRLRGSEAHAEAMARKVEELEAALRDEATDRSELEDALAVKSRDVQTAEASAEDAIEKLAEVEVQKAQAEKEAEAKSREVKALEEAARRMTAEVEAARQLRESEHGAALAKLEAAAAERVVASGDEVLRLQAELAACLGSLKEADQGEAKGHKETAALRSELSSAQDELVQVEVAMHDAAAAHDAEALGMQMQVAAALEAQATAVGSVEAAVTPLQELAESLQSRLAEEQEESGRKISALKEAFGQLRSEYESTLSELHAGLAERDALKAKCDEVERLLAEESTRQEEVAKSLQAELGEREAALAAALDESHLRALEVAEVTQSAAEEAEALQNAVQTAEASRDAVEVQLLQVGEELRGTSAERGRLEAEVASLSALARSELAEAEAQRLQEVSALLEEAKLAEARLTEERKALAQTQADKAAALGAAEARLGKAEATAGEQRRLLWQRLKRQAVVQAAAVRSLQQSLSQSESQKRLLQNEYGSTSASQADALLSREREVSRLRMAMREAEAVHVKQLAASGVTALKHGRKGKPHLRHVRCTGMRLEWGRADSGNSARGYDKFIPLHEISGIHAGLATDVAQRSGKGRDELFLCVTSNLRSLDLEFPSRAARDAWFSVMSRWRDVTLKGSGALALGAGAPSSAMEAGGVMRNGSFGLQQQQQVESMSAAPSVAAQICLDELPSMAHQTASGATSRSSPPRTPPGDAGSRGPLSASPVLMEAPA